MASGHRAQRLGRLQQLLEEVGPLTQADLARRLSLPPASVSYLVRELVADGRLRQESVVRAGRRANLVSRAHLDHLVAGVDVGTRRIRVGVGDLDGRVVAEGTVPTPEGRGAEDVATRTADTLARLLDEHGVPSHRLRHLGLSLTAPVDHDAGVVRPGAILRSWQRPDLTSWFPRRLGLDATCSVDNDANMAALGDHLSSGRRDGETLALIKVTHGIGLGLVVDGRLHRGRGGVAGEIGHATVNPRGGICGCGGRGCLMLYAGAPMFHRLLPDDDGAGSTSAGRAEVGIVGRTAARAAAGDLAARRVVEEAAEQIGLAVANLAIVVAPDVVVLSGELAAAGDLLREPVRRALARTSMFETSAPTVVVAPEPDRLELLGALAMAAAAVRAGSERA